MCQNLRNISDILKINLYTGIYDNFLIFPYGFIMLACILKHNNLFMHVSEIYVNGLHCMYFFLLAFFTQRCEIHPFHICSSFTPIFVYYYIVWLYHNCAYFFIVS